MSLNRVVTDVMMNFSNCAIRYVKKRGKLVVTQDK